MKNWIGRTWESWYIYPFLLIIIIVSYLLWSLFRHIFFILETDDDSARYLLSTLVQSEAAILAIVITLSLIAVQLAASSYSSRVIEIFKNSPDFRILISVYIFAIIFSSGTLKLIESDGNLPRLMLESLISISYIIGIFAFLSLIPYIQNIYELLKPSEIISRLSTRITMDNILSDDDPIQPITDIVISSLMRYDEATVREGLNAIKNKIINILNDSALLESREEDISNLVYGHFYEIGTISINRNDEYATNQFIHSTEEIIYASIDKNLKFIAQPMVSLLGKIGVISAKQTLEGTANQAASSLGKVGVRAAKQDFELVAEWAAASLRDIGIKSTEYKLSSVYKKVVEELEHIGVNSIESVVDGRRVTNKKPLENAAGNAAGHLGNIGAKAVGQELEDDSIKKTIVSLRRIGVYSVRNHLSNVIRQTADSLEFIAIAAQREEKYSIVLYAVESINIAGTALVEEGRIKTEDDEDAAHRIVDALHKISKLDYDRNTEQIVNIILNMIISIKCWAELNGFEKVKSRSEYAAGDISIRFPMLQPTPDSLCPNQP